MKPSARTGYLIMALFAVYLVMAQMPSRNPTPLPDAPQDAASIGIITRPYYAGDFKVADVTVVDINTGQAIFLGTVDLRPTLERIAAGQKHPHRNDGEVFRNAGRLLPRRPSGYYREYVVPTPGISGPGPQRLVLGTEGEVYYTFDHYDSFIRVDGE
ncbi:MAG: hypothetical protein LUC93_14445 [Planctomycetaceae bacterium]|nr:hypothetical protein [Planctomycetaceae bacterium]